MRRNTVASLHANKYASPLDVAARLRRIAGKLTDQHLDGKHKNMMVRANISLSFAYPGEIGTRVTLYGVEVEK